MTEQVRIVDLARRARPERIGLAILVISAQVLLLFMLRSGALSDAWRTLEAHSSRWLIAVAIAMQVVVLAGVARIMRRRKAVLSIDPGEVRFRGHSVPIRSIARLGFYQPAMRRGLSGWYSIETHGGRIVRFEVHPRDHGDPGIAAVLNAIEQFSGRRWIGRVEAGRSFETLIGAIRRGSGGTWSWLARNTFTIQSHAAEMNDPVYRWTTPLFYVPLIASLLAIVFLLTPGAKLHYGVTKLDDGLDSGTGLAPFPRFLILMLILGWICTAYGVNLFVLLMRTQTRSREALEAQLNAAREVQMRLLPSAPPEMIGFELSAVCLPALEVGGDYFDFVALPSGKVVAAIGDVSGKGLPAALLMTMVKGCLTTALQGDGNIASAAALIDRSIHASPDRTFVTLALASLEPGTGNVRVVRAGHNQPLLVRNGNSEWISPSGPALGMRIRTSVPRSWDTAELQLERGDLLVLYTDGVTEEVSSADEQYGAERLAAFIRANSNRHLEDLKNAILADVQAFRGRAGTSDDLTLVLIRRS